MPFSVLMSLYSKERPEFLRQSLDSVFNQTLPPDEVILVEDGPLTDELYQILNEYALSHPELRRVPLAENRGLGYALNEGLKYCSYDIVARMDSDDICKVSRFERQIRFMEENSDIDVCSSWIEEFEGDINNVLSIKKLPATHPEISQYIKKRNPINHPSSCFRKQAVIKSGGYLHFPLFEDWYLWARMFAGGYKFANIQEPLLSFRISKEMYRRRGGIRYALTNFKFQSKLHKLGIISFVQSLISGTVRGAVYIMPNSLRAFIYKNILRS